MVYRLFFSKLQIAKQNKKVKLIDLYLNSIQCVCIVHPPTSYNFQVVHETEVMVNKLLTQDLCWLFVLCEANKQYNVPASVRVLTETTLEQILFRYQIRSTYVPTGFVRPSCGSGLASFVGVRLRNK